MATKVLYVHGTGVRKAAFEVNAARLASGLARIGAPARLMPCLWGDAMGAKLHLAGASIPEFVAAPHADDDTDDVALWDLLAHDCLFELRELAAALSVGLESPAVREQKQMLRLQIPGLAEDGTLLELVTEYASRDQWAQSVAEVAAAPAVDQAIAAVRTALGPLRLAVGRAVVASLQNRLADDGFPNLPLTTRDALVAQSVELLGGGDLGGIADWFKSRLAGWGLRWATTKARRKREALYGMAAPMAGDVVMYQARGQAIRNFIAERIRACDGEVVLLAHSLGGIACVDLLIQQDLSQVRALVTVGTQASFLYEINALTALPFGQALPQHFPATWLNFFDCNDLLSYKAATVFSGHAEDVEVTSGQPFPHSHSAYWDAPVFWERLKLLLE